MYFTLAEPATPIRPGLKNASRITVSGGSEYCLTLLYAIFSQKYSIYQYIIFKYRLCPELNYGRPNMAEIWVINFQPLQQNSSLINTATNTD